MTGESAQARIDVLMPTVRQATFIARAIRSLLEQTLTEWQLLVIDDGSPDETCKQVRPFLTDPRVSYARLPENRGLGAALNYGLDQSNGELIAYLPSDDLYHADHLASLVRELDHHPDPVLAYSGLRHHYNRTAPDHAPAEPIQLVRMARARLAATRGFHLRSPRRPPDRLFPRRDQGITPGSRASINEKRCRRYRVGACSVVSFLGKKLSRASIRELCD